MKITDVIYDPIDGTEDFQEVVGLDLSQGGYEWDSLEAWYSPSKRRYFWVEGSGCSCNSLGDDVRRLDELANGNRDELVSAIRAKYEEGYNVSPSDMLADIATVKTFREAK
jgi:hypothetical protein